jgi:hypothetical protein
MMANGLRQPVQFFQQFDRMPELNGKLAGHQEDSWRQPVQAGPRRRGAHRDPDPRRDQVLA